MVYILLIVFFAFFVGQLIEEIPSKLLAFFFNCLLLGVIFLLTLGITSTSDWTMYYYLFKLEIDKTDLIFYQLSVYFNKLNLSFEDLYCFHLVMSVCLYLILITRFTRNFFFVFLLYLLLDYVHFTNQIRYYLGLPIMFLGFYNLFLKKKYIISIALIIFGILCHSALSVLLIIIPVYYFIPVRKYIRTCFYISTVAFLIIYMIFNTGIGATISHFGFYLESENGSSLIGGLFNAIPYILIISFLLISSSKYLKDKKKLNDPHFIFLYKMTFFSIVFIPGAFLIQIIGHRFVMTFTIFWFMYYLSLVKDLPMRKKFLNYIMFGVVLFAVAFSIYILPDFVLKDNHFVNELIRIIESIPYLNGTLYDRF